MQGYDGAKGEQGEVGAPGGAGESGGPGDGGLKVCVASMVPPLICTISITIIALAYNNF